jgi:hypothetical protein
MWPSRSLAWCAPRVPAENELTIRHTHTRALTHTHPRTHTHTHPLTRTRTHALTHTRAHTHIHTRTHTRARAHTHTQTHTHTRARERTQTHAHTSTQAHTHEHTHTHRHARAHTQTQKHMSWSPHTVQLAYNRQRKMPTWCRVAGQPAPSRGLKRCILGRGNPTAESGRDYPRPGSDVPTLSPGCPCKSESHLSLRPRQGLETAVPALASVHLRQSCERACCVTASAWLQRKVRVACREPRIMS